MSPRRPLLSLALIALALPAAGVVSTAGAVEAGSIAETATPGGPEAGPEAGAEAPAEQDKGPKALSGMSILGNQEAPKALVIVPWKSSEIGNAVGISTMLDDSKQPVDRDVFLRALSYYEIRSETAP